MNDSSFCRLYGFPNEQSYPAFVNRLDWYDLGELPCLVKVINPKVVIEKRIHSATIATIAEKPGHLLLRLWKGNKRHKPLDRIKIRNMDTLDKRFDDLWLRAKDQFCISVWKDSDYLNWRYLSCPDRKYTVLAAEEENDLIGFIVLRCEVGQRQVGRIIDCLFVPEKATAASLLISAGSDFLRDQGMGIAFCHIFEHSPFYHLFTSQGFFKHTAEDLPFVVRVNAPDLPSSIILDRKQWHLMEGDIDQF